MKEITMHQPVLLAEVLENLAIKPDGIYVDATFGRGGHTQAILNQLNSNGRLLSMDKDPDAVAFAHTHLTHDKRFTIQQGSFAELAAFVKEQQVYGKINGILLDLGVSSPQLDDPERGFSFMHSGKLDMRMDYSQGIDASQWLASVSEKELADVLWEYGEERFSRRIARAIIFARQQQAITTTHQLAEIIAKAHPAWQKGKNPATRSFQAIRIAINEELKDLQLGLEQSLESLSIGGRLLVISFHSLEDRIVKQFMQHHERNDSFPPKLPIKHTVNTQKLKRVNRAIKPSMQEVTVNPRARSAILRIGEKLS